LARQDLIIGVSGVRGLVFDPLSPEVCARFASSLVTVLGQGAYVVGRDPRPSGDILKRAVIAGLAAAGAGVTDVGTSTTPTIQLAVEDAHARGGIAVTASHNPAEWNALKFISGSGAFLESREIERLATVFKSGGIRYASFDEAGAIEEDRDAGGRHIARVLGVELIDVPALTARRFKVAIDCVNGAAGVVIPELLARLGCEVFPMGCEPTGIFARPPEPLAENLKDLCDLVKSRRADLGMAFDPDGDRLALVDEAGSPLGEDYTLAICADLALGKAKGALVTNLSTSMVVEDIVRKHGAAFYRTPIGEINVVARMKTTSSLIGGEGNGGVILPAVHYGRDALVGAALVLQALLESKMKLSQMMMTYPKYVILKRKVSFDQPPDFGRVTAAIREHFPEARFNLDDGVRADFGKSWLHVRKSGTEPVIRLIAEAEDRARALALIDGALGVITH
jgi:phosphomannomutase